VTATPPANGQVPDVRYSLDAQRTVVWFSVAGVPIASSWSSMLRGDAGRSIALHTDGSTVDANVHALPLVAAASVATGTDRDRMLDDAEALDQQHPSYYGAAWVALGRTLLTTDVFRLS
jgi:endoglucanase